MRCCAGDEGSWPFGVALRREAPNHLMLRWLKTVVVSDEEKASEEASGGDREGERKRIVADVSKPTQMTSKPGCFGDSGMSLAGVRLLARRCPACRRREPGLRLPRGTGEGVSRYCPARWRGRARGSAPSGADAVRG
jgi:hypothetical protein